MPGVRDPVQASQMHSECSTTEPQPAPSGASVKGKEEGLEGVEQGKAFALLAMVLSLISSTIYGAPNRTGIIPECRVRISP